MSNQAKEKKKKGNSNKQKVRKIDTKKITKADE